MKFDETKLSFLDKLQGRNGKYAVKYGYENVSFLVYPQVLPFSQEQKEEVTLHYDLDDKELMKFIDDQEWLDGALKYCETDYFKRV